MFLEHGVVISQCLNFTHSLSVLKNDTGADVRDPLYQIITSRKKHEGGKYTECVISTLQQPNQLLII